MCPQTNLAPNHFVHLPAWSLYVAPSITLSSCPFDRMLIACWTFSFASPKEPSLARHRPSLARHWARLLPVLTSRIRWIWSAFVKYSLALSACEAHGPIGTQEQLNTSFSTKDVRQSLSLFWNRKWWIEETASEGENTCYRFLNWFWCFTWNQKPAETLYHLLKQQLLTLSSYSFKTNFR